MDSGVGYDPVIDSPDRLCEYYRDDFWLKTYPLTLQTVLDYFAFSPFYDRNCINERIKLQGMDAVQAAKLVGVEYVVSSPGDPNLFVIERIHRRGPSESVALSVYYCINGTIYQSPDLATLLSARVERAAHLVTKAIHGVEQLRSALLTATAAGIAQTTDSDARVDDILTTVALSYETDAERKAT